MRVLREKSLATKLLLLLEIISKKPARLSSLAYAVGITPQAVSDYIKRLTQEGFVVQKEGRYSITKEGVDFVHSNLLDLKRFTQERIKYLNIIDKCIAIAGEDVKKGERVGLFMKKGYLFAFPSKRSSSTGVALRDAKRGEDVSVGELDGIVEHHLGSLYIIPVLYSVDRGGRDVPLERLEELLGGIEYDKMAVGDLVALSVVRRLGRNPDFEFAPVDASMDAVKRGLSVCFLGSLEQVEGLISLVKKFNGSSSDKISYRVLNI